MTLRYHSKVEASEHQLVLGYILVMKINSIQSYNLFVINYSERLHRPKNCQFTIITTS